MIPIGTKQIRLSKMGKDRNVLVNQLTGEVLGTHVTTYKKVDRGHEFRTNKKTLYF
ncbi:hypothetical protein [Arsenophonus sp. ENCA]|uniref:hypothetical protein n=1 Tax=Arsenophonus sp. ENCA TaxID=1987579 RepID=UPI0025C50B03|nr:hypothetical protein [Arsenophonus sp. ENCA]